ncbi:MAG TPA: type II CRISPR-associated endonuclease Cas1 [Candidatus Avalokitesvara rifleensis]|uniref:type II CRISPR-associated endonuclease Cas1 n=1 Tax=Candidatus Avalokitesvara rifleensis TaxID=3367620 RepID=UPI004027EB60
MTNNRILDLSDEPARLSVRYANLVIEREAAEPVTVPFADLAVLVVSHPQVSLTHAVLSGLTASGGVFVACNEKRLPAGMLLPIEGHFTQAERFEQQARASLPIRKRLWQQIVQAKVRAQAGLLSEICCDDRGLAALASRVKSGDKGFIEGLAAQRYWPALFEGIPFYRDRSGPPPNQCLNYGYAVLRAVVARAVCAAGLHPSLGLHHHNKYDAFRLADDLMEPFRPIVDRTVVNLIRTRGPDTPLDREAKAEILSALSGRLTLDGEKRTLFDIAARTASSLAAVFAGEQRELLLPEITSHPKRNP